MLLDEEHNRFGFVYDELHMESYARAISGLTRALETEHWTWSGMGAVATVRIVFSSTARNLRSLGQVPPPGFADALVSQIPGKKSGYKGQA